MSEVAWSVEMGLACAGLLVGALCLAIAIHLANRKHDAEYEADRWRRNAQKAARAMHRVMERQGVFCGGCDCAPELLDDAALHLADEAWEEFVWVAEEDRDE